ncbi:MAG: S-layer homology domain-containing protein [Oscillospiraceae bacterium]|nr:S-layer homology domain-containing protein [Oscillospiraceae bacterium]
MMFLKHKKVKDLLRRCGAALLSLVLLSEVFAFAAPEAQAEKWSDQYMQTMADWGVLRDDIPGNMDPDHHLTRAEFVAMVNRAYGYTKVGPVPFTDISPKDWYYEDICIAYNVGYFKGFTETTAGPNSLLTREQAAVFIGRNMSLEQGTGEVLGFTDSRNFSNYSRHMIEAVCDEGIIGGYSDGSFRPKNNVTRGHVAAMLTRAVGTPIRQSGEHVLGGVYGNVTIANSGVKLKDTTIYGNLYISGGVELGDVMLENVKVLGRITVCGAGESEKGENSVVLRNVTANELRIDNLNDQYLSLKADGLTSIDEVSVLTGAYLEDLVTDAQGLKNITLDAAEGAQFTLAGNIKEVTNKTPGSTLIMGQGTAQVVTVDEKALESTVDVKNEVVLGKLNLDTATDVIGAGDITDAVVNTNGTTIEMLPDTITVRPGIMADVADEDMDSVAAKESSEDPRILAGYPVAKQIAPKSADVVFRTNKKGTIYWALTALSDGSVKEEDLIEPPAYASKIIKNGTIAATASNTDFIAKLSGLTADGSYYVSAILVDNRGVRSAVKVAAFKTPDDTTPAFTSGYPTAAVVKAGNDEQVVQANVMANKNCRMYYALLPKGSVAPKPNEFKANAVTGNLGFGMVDLRKNTPMLVSKINATVLKEVTEYDLYLWLTDVDGAKSSAVKKLTVKTLDTTPPHIKTLTVTDVKAKAVSLSFSLDEPGTLFWAVVKDGKTLYTSAEKDFYNKDEAKAQIETGLNAVKKGSAKAAKAMTEYKFTISGLEAQTGYDLYYVAKDTAGNYCVYTSSLVPPMDIHTLDEVPPTVHQEFDGKDEGSNPNVSPDANITLVFSENVQGMHDMDAPSGKPDRHRFLDLYQGSDADREKLAAILPEYIKLYVDGETEPVKARTKDSDDDWVIDYRKAKVELSADGSGELFITFPHSSNDSENALNLAGGETYYFTVEYMADTSTAENYMEGNKNVVTLPKFNTIDAQMHIARGAATGKLADGTELIFDMNFKVSPVTTSSVNDSVMWDLILWSEDTMKIEVYYHDEGDETWTKMEAAGSTEAAFAPTGQTPRVGISLTRELWTDTGKKDTPNFEPLNTVIEKREYGIIVTELNKSPNRDTWSGSVSIDVVPIAGDKGSLSSLSLMCVSPEDYQSYLERNPGAVKENGVPTSYTTTGYFRDKTAPSFVDGDPTFDAGDSGVNISVQLSRPDTRYYCVITEVGNITTVLTDDTQITKDNDNWYRLPQNGIEFNGNPVGNVKIPGTNTIVKPNFSSDKYIVRQGTYDGSRLDIQVKNGLKADTKYIAYFVLQGGTPESISPNVFAFRFQTEKATRPILEVSLNNPSAMIESDRAADGRYMMVVAGREGDILNTKMSTIWNAAAAAEHPDIADKVKGMTVLEAMKEKVHVGDNHVGSAFDIFATEDGRNTVTGWFNSASTDGSTIVKVGTTALPANQMVNINCQKDMVEGNQEYWFIAMGKSALGSSAAFAAECYLFYPVKNPPLVTEVGTTVETDVTDNFGDAIKKAYSGELRIVFDSYLYWNKDNKFLQVVDKPLGSTTIDSTKHVCSGALLDKTTKVAIVPGVSKYEKDNPYCQSLLLEFNNVKIGETIAFSQSLANNRGYTSNVPLTLKLTLTENEYGYFMPTFEITSTDWDATVKK